MFPRRAITLGRVVLPASSFRPDASAEAAQETAQEDHDTTPGQGNGEFVQYYKQHHQLTPGPYHDDLYQMNLENMPLTEDQKELSSANSIMRVVKHPQLRENLEKLGIRHLNDSQMQGVEAIAGGSDVIVTTTHATGIPLLYFVPIIDRVACENDALAQAQTHGYTTVFHPNIEQKDRGNLAGAPYATKLSPVAIIVANHTELTSQLFKTIVALCDNLRVHPKFVSARDRVKDCIDQARGECDLVVTTAGRLATLSNRGHVDMGRLKIVVFDEVNNIFKSPQQLLHISQSFSNGHFNLDTGQGDGVQRCFVDGCPDESWTHKVSSGWVRKGADGRPLNLKILRLTKPVEDRRVFHFVEVHGKGDFFTEVASFVQLQGFGRLVVFTNSKKEADRLGCILQETFPNRCVEVSHSGFNQEVRENIDDILHDPREEPIVVGCNLHNCGVNIPDLNDVLIVGVPFDKDRFIQGANRVARVGNNGTATMIFQRRWIEEHTLYREIVGWVQGGGRVIKYSTFAPLAPQISLADPDISQLPSNLRHNNHKGNSGRNEDAAVTGLTHGAEPPAPPQSERTAVSASVYDSSSQYVRPRVVPLNGLANTPRVTGVNRVLGQSRSNHHTSDTQRQRLDESWVPRQVWSTGPDRKTCWTIKGARNTKTGENREA